MFPTIAEMSKRGLLEGNPVKKLKEKQYHLVSSEPFECKRCHYYKDSKEGLTHCPNCHLKI
jgi:predicted Zn-ribbon and HTH transcriptional regulator